MTGLAGRRRVWKAARAVEAEHGHGVALDGRPLKTPAQRPFVVPTSALAEAVAAEWAVQGERIAPETMPFTRLVSTALDRVADAMPAVLDEVAAYAETDLLCYRAPHPEALRRRQAEAWDPPLAWARARHGAVLSCAEGVMYVAQAPEAVARLRGAAEAVVEEHGAIGLTALAELVALGGSLVLGLAVAEAAMAPPEAWAASRVDEEHQIAEWGEDAEAAALAETRRAAFERAALVLAWSRGA
jgi:chaperone required for assembly of F1-ATPase